MKKLALLLLMLMSLTAFKTNKHRIITGTVHFADGEQEPIAGAVVKIKDQKEWVTTDVNGRYAISVPKGKQILTISYVGCTAVNVEVKKQSVIDIYLGTPQPINILEMGKY